MKFLILCTVVLALAGCGGSATAPTSPSTTDSAASGAAPDGRYIAQTGTIATSFYVDIAAGGVVGHSEWSLVRTGHKSGVFSGWSLVTASGTYPLTIALVSPPGAPG